jgi:hypothetical protein
VPLTISSLLRELTEKQSAPSKGRKFCFSMENESIRQFKSVEIPQAICFSRRCRMSPDTWNSVKGGVACTRWTVLSGCKCIYLSHGLAVHTAVWFWWSLACQIKWPWPIWRNFSIPARSRSLRCFGLRKSLLATGTWSHPQHCAYSWRYRSCTWLNKHQVTTNVGWALLYY